eukprot:g3048.t1
MIRVLQQDPATCMLDKDPDQGGSSSPSTSISASPARPLKRVPYGDSSGVTGDLYHTGTADDAQDNGNGNGNGNGKASRKLQSQRFYHARPLNRVPYGDSSGVTGDLYHTGTADDAQDNGNGNGNGKASRKLQSQRFYHARPLNRVPYGDSSGVTGDLYHTGTADDAQDNGNGNGNGNGNDKASQRPPPRGPHLSTRRVLRGRAAVATLGISVHTVPQEIELCFNTAEVGLQDEEV